MAFTSYALDLYQNNIAFLLKYAILPFSDACVPIKPSCQKLGRECPLKAGYGMGYAFPCLLLRELS